METCVICAEEPVVARGWCNRHYMSWRHHRDPHQAKWRKGDPPEDRFWSKVQKSDGCWAWTGHTLASGYGQFSIGYRKVRAHRYSWELYNGPIPDGLIVMHRCDNPPCVRPDHLFLGTPADNTADMVQKGRARRPGRPRRA